MKKGQVVRIYIDTNVLVNYCTEQKKRVKRVAVSVF
jgi:hypothetical protein